MDLALKIVECLNIAYYIIPAKRQKELPSLKTLTNELYQRTELNKTKHRLAQVFLIILESSSKNKLDFNKDFVNGMIIDVHCLNLRINPTDEVAARTKYFLANEMTYISKEEVLARIKLVEELPF